MGNLKGIYCQIREQEIEEPRVWGNFDDETLADFLKATVKLLENSQKEALKIEKERYDFIEKLKEKSKSFGEPIPNEILYKFYGSMGGKIYVGSDFYIKHKKWLE